MKGRKSKKQVRSRRYWSFDDKPKRKQVKRPVPSGRRRIVSRVPTRRRKVGTPPSITAYYTRQKQARQNLIDRKREIQQTLVNLRKEQEKLEKEQIDLDLALFEQLREEEKALESDDFLEQFGKMMK